MLIKNSLRLLINNLNVVFKAMLYSLAVVFLTYLLLTVFFSDIIGKLTKNKEFLQLIGSVNELWNAFISGNLRPSIDLVSCFEQFMEAFRVNLVNYVWSFVGLIIGGYLLTVLNSLCVHTLTYMMNARMSSFEQKGFFASLISNLKRSLPFEAWFSLLSILGVIVSISLALLFIVYTFTYIYLLSVIIGLWIFIVTLSLYLSLTSLLRPLYVNGAGGKELFKCKFTSKTFRQVFASFLFSLVAFMAVNVMTFITTLGAGIVVSVPLTQLFFVFLQLVLLYSLEGKKYYVDYETIEVPNKIKQDSANADFLNDVEV